MALNIIKNYLTKNRCYQQGRKRTPIGIQIHTIGTAQGTAKAVADYWNQSSVSACTNYICDADVSGRVYQLLPEEYYSWADAGYGNRNLITIEIAESDFMRYTGGASYEITNQENFKRDILRGYDTAVQLCADICKKHKWNPKKKLSSGLYLISSHNEGRMAGLSSAHVDPSHLWPQFGLSMDTFRQAVVNAMNGTHTDDDIVTTTWYRVRKTWKDEKSQIGAYVQVENAKKACPYGYSVFDEDGKVVYQNKTKPIGSQAADFANLTEGQAAETILEMIHTVDKSGVLYSVTAAQMILESGYVKTPLAKSANNCFGMKKILSGNSWANSSWNGKSVVMIDTQEWDGSKMIAIKDDFRKYPCIEDSIRDHSAYLLGAMNGSKLRYDGLLNCKNYTEAITLIKKGGYATDPNYISKIKAIIQRFNLDRYDAEIAPKEEVKTEDLYYIQCGVFKTKRNATALAAKLKEAGFHAEVETRGSQWRVVSKRKKDGKPFKKLSVAEKRATQIRAAGFAALAKKV